MRTEGGSPLSAADLLAEGAAPGGGGLAELPGRLSRFSVARHRAIEQVKHIRGCTCHKGNTGNPLPFAPGELEKATERLARCGDFLLFRHYYTVDELRLHGADFCKQALLCPLCAIRRAAKHTKAYLDRIAVVLAEAPHLRPYLLGLTVRSGFDLWERYRHLQRSRQALVKTRHGARQSSELVKAVGGVSGDEITWNDEHGWHPHSHMLALCDDEPNQWRLSEDWHSITGDSYIVDVRPITGEVLGGIVEVLKYPLKFAAMHPALTLEAFAILRGRRMVSSFGCLHGVDVPDELTDEPLADLPYVDMFFRFLAGSGYLLKSRRLGCDGSPGIAVA